VGEGELEEDGGDIVSWERRTERSSGIECIVKGTMASEVAKRQRLVLLSDEEKLSRHVPTMNYCTPSDKITPFNCI